DSFFIFGWLLLGVISFGGSIRGLCAACFTRSLRCIAHGEPLPCAACFTRSPSPCAVCFTRSPPPCAVCFTRSPPPCAVCFTRSPPPCAVCFTRLGRAIIPLIRHCDGFIGKPRI